MGRKRIVIVGNGMVGYKFCEKLIAKGGRRDFDIIVFGEEKHPAYDRVQLTQYFSEKTAEDLTLAGKEWYAENGIELRLGDRITSIDRDKKILTSQSGSVIPFDKIVLATG